jgi:hypothetical protein
MRVRCAQIEMADLLSKSRMNISVDDPSLARDIFVGIRKPCAPATRSIALVLVLRSPLRCRHADRVPLTAPPSRLDA